MKTSLSAEDTRWGIAGRAGNARAVPAARYQTSPKFKILCPNGLWRVSRVPPTVQGEARVGISGHLTYA